jgi:pimeloyl-ACP methyl ester carboxylesterase
MKTALFIPGFYETLHDRDYPGVLKAFEKRGHKAEFVPLNWRRTNLRHWLDEFNEVYGRYKPEDTVLAGFSFGAVTAFAAAAKRNPSELWLCSLSPYFEGDNPKPQGLKAIGKRRVQAFANTDFPNLAKQIKCPTKVLYGALESDGIKHRAHEAHRLIRAQIIEVPDTAHDVASRQYIDAIAKS